MNKLSEDDLKQFIQHKMEIEYWIKTIKNCPTDRKSLKAELLHLLENGDLDAFKSKQTALMSPSHQQGYTWTGHRPHFIFRGSRLRRVLSQSPNFNDAIHTKLQSIESIKNRIVEYEHQKLNNMNPIIQDLFEMKSWMNPNEYINLLSTCYILAPQECLMSQIMKYQELPYGLYPTASNAYEENEIYQFCQGMIGLMIGQEKHIGQTLFKSINILSALNNKDWCNHLLHMINHQTILNTDDGEKDFIAEFKNQMINIDSSNTVIKYMGHLLIEKLLTHDQLSHFNGDFFRTLTNQVINIILNHLFLYDENAFDINNIPSHTSILNSTNPLYTKEIKDLHQSCFEYAENLSRYRGSFFNDRKELKCGDSFVKNHHSMYKYPIK